MPGEYRHVPPLVRIIAPLLVLGLFALLLWRSDVTALQSAFAQLSAGPILLGLCLVQLQILLSAIRWRFTAARLGQSIGLGKAIREYYVASLLNQSLPGGMGGDAIRAWRMRLDGTGGWKLPAKAILYERLSGQAVFLLLVAIGLPVWPLLITGPSPFPIGWLAVTGLCVALLLTAMLVWFTQQRFRKVLGTLRADASDVFLRGGAWRIQTSLSLAIVIAYGAVFMLSSHAVGANLPWQAILTIIPLCLLSMLIPVGLGGWGTREAAAMALWPVFGFRPEDGLAASLLYGALSLAGAAPALLILAVEAMPHNRQRK